MAPFPRKSYDQKRDNDEAARFRPQLSQIPASMRFKIATSSVGAEVKTQYDVYMLRISLTPAFTVQAAAQVAIALWWQCR
jgi:hypothetical protein